MMGVYYTSPENTVQKHLFWLVSSTPTQHIRHNHILHATTVFQCLPGCDAQSTFLPQPSNSFTSCPIHLRRCRVPFLRRSYRKVGPTRSVSFVVLTICSNDKYLYMGGPLLAGITVVALTSLAPMALPLGTRALAITESISLYGGLAVFGGFVLYEYVSMPTGLAARLVQISQHAKNSSSCSPCRARCHRARPYEGSNWPRA